MFIALKTINIICFQTFSFTATYCSGLAYVFNTKTFSHKFIMIYVSPFFQEFLSDSSEISESFSKCFGFKGQIIFTFFGFEFFSIFLIMTFACFELKIAVTITFFAAPYISCTVCMSDQKRISCLFSTLNPGL